MLVNIKGKYSSSIINTDELEAIYYSRDSHKRFSENIVVSLKSGVQFNILNESDINGCDGTKIIEWLFTKLSKPNTTIDISDFNNK